MTSRKQRPPSPEKQQLLKDISHRLGVLRRHLGHTPQSFAAGDDSSPRNDRRPVFQDGSPIPPVLRLEGRA